MTTRKAEIPSALTATCHCGAIRIQVKRAPRTVTSCNCSLCRRYGVLWAYYSAKSVKIVAPKGGLSSYSWRHRNIAFFRCKKCGCVTHYKYRKQWGKGRAAVNANNFDPGALQDVRIRKLDGASSWKWKYLDKRERRGVGVIHL
ncbi:MAG: GFA family protein [Bacillota bacterium]